MKPQNILESNQIGIIGSGHLGQTLAKVLIDHQFPRENIRISYGGNPATLASIQNAGLYGNIAENESICRTSDIIFFCIKPQDFKTLKKLNFSSPTTFISCMAGISTVTFQSALGIDAIRVMPSGPDSILQGKGVTALFPRRNQAANILSFMGFKIYELSSEELLHPYTAMVCLPAALLLAKRWNLDIGEDIRKLAAVYPGLDFQAIYHWACEVMPKLESELTEDDFIRKMMTKGGITEAIVESLRSKKNFLEAMHRGIGRSKEIAERTRILLGES